MVFSSFFKYIQSVCETGLYSILLDLFVQSCLTRAYFIAFNLIMKSSAKVVDLTSLPMCVYVVMIIYFEKVTL